MLYCYTEFIFRKGDVIVKAYERLLRSMWLSAHRVTKTVTLYRLPSAEFGPCTSVGRGMKALGLTDVYLDDQCYLYGKLPATEGLEEKACYWLYSAHMDTVSDFCDHDITPVITENYNGEDLVLGTSGLTLSTETFPHLKDLKGRTLITSDGTTVLGADYKAGSRDSHCDRTVTGTEHPTWSDLRCIYTG